jgi:hypothetical protein
MDADPRFLALRRELRLALFAAQEAANGCESTGADHAAPRFLLAWTLAMRQSDGVHQSMQGRVVGLICALAGCALAGCGLSEEAGMLTVDPGRYSAYHCNDLATRWKELLKREQDLRGLMDKASESAGGAVIGSVAYRADYDNVLGEERLVQRTAAEKKCEPVSSSYQSDQTIR